MNAISRTLSGGILIILGVFLIVLGFFISWITLIYGVPIFVIGLFIFLNKNEDKIEEIKGGKK